MRPIDPTIVTGKQDYTLLELAQARHKICAGCSNNDNGLCWACGCYITSKISNPSDYCPLRKW